MSPRGTEGGQLLQRRLDPLAGAAPEMAAEDARLVRLMWLALAGLLLVRLIALRFNATDLFFDEAQYWSWSLEPAFGYYSKPPLIAWLIGLSTTVCGVSEACIRVSAPLLHTATAAAIYMLGRRLYDVRTGVVAALVYTTLPAVSLSSGIVSTDVPLLLCWAVALIGFAALFDTRAWWPALVLGLGIGLGLNAKYAMAWFALCAGVYLALTPARRGVLRDARLWAGLGLGVLLILPNMAWNLSNSFATFSHTADNAKWSGSLINPLKALEFFGAQFGVFGPVLFAALLTATWRARRAVAAGALPEADRLLLAFALPVLVAITLQALISRAHANWAAVSYVAATVLVSAVLLRELSFGWLRASFLIHAAVLALLIAGTSTAGKLALPSDPFARTLGWRAVADATRAELQKARAAGKPYGTVIADDRPVSAELLYYMRDETTPLKAWREKPKPQDHFELTRPFKAGAGEPVLLVSVKREIDAIRAQFAEVALLGVRTLPAGAASTRQLSLYALSGYRGR